MQLVLPFVWHIVCVLYDSRHELFWVKNSVVLGYHAPRNSQNTTKYADVEEYRAVRSDFKVEYQIRVQDGSQQEHRGKRACDECHKSEYKVGDHSSVEQRGLTA